jgi:PAS domain S-box-containing protein
VSEAIGARAGPEAAVGSAVAGLVALGVAATGGAVYVLAVSRIAPSPVAQSVLSAVVCLTFVGAGAAALRLRPYARFGLLLAATGFASLISVLHDANDAAAYAVGVFASNLVYATLAHALLAYPSGRLGSAWRRALVAVAYLDVLALQALAVVFDPLTRYHSAHPRNLALVDSRPALATGLYELEAGVAVALAFVVAAMLTRRVWAATPAARRQQLPVTAGGKAALLLFSLALVLVPLSSRIGFFAFGLGLIAALALPAAFLATVAQGRLSRVAVGDLLLELRDPTHPSDLEEALRRALGDPTLRLGRLAPGGGYVDSFGVPLPLPERGGAQVATAVQHGGARVGTLVHDRSLRLRAELLDAVGAAAGFALGNERALSTVRKVEARNRALLGAIPDLILRIDRNGRYLDVRANDPAGLPIKPDDLIGRHVRDVAPPRVADAILACARRARESGEMHSVEYELELEGTVHYCESRMVPSSGGEVVIIMRDFTERRRSDAELRRLAAEQAALQRVATRVAGNAPPEQVFQLVTEEVCRLLGLRTAVLHRFEGGRRSTVVGKFGAPTGRFELGNSIEIETGSALQVAETGAPARSDYSQLTGAGAVELRELGFCGSVGVPITVAGTTWGALVVALKEDETLPLETEHRLQAFAELVALAVASADARDALAASRLRIVEAGDTERRRLERNLHDGAQQRLVALAVGLRLAQAKLRSSPDDADRLLQSLAGELGDALTELRELAQGIHPAVLAERGLAPALEVVAARAPLAVRLDVDLSERLPEQVETAAYYTVSEALANVVKHAEASVASVRVSCDGGQIVVEVADDGVGGADAELGSGLRGLRDRVETLDGELLVESPPGRGTVVRAELPTKVGRLATGRRSR